MIGEQLPGVLEEVIRYERSKIPNYVLYANRPATAEKIDSERMRSIRQEVNNILDTNVCDKVHSYALEEVHSLTKDIYNKVESEEFLDKVVMRIKVKQL